VPDVPGPGGAEDVAGGAAAVVGFGFAVPAEEGAVAEGALEEDAVAEGAVADDAVAEGPVVVADGAVAEGAFVDGTFAAGVAADAAGGSGVAGGVATGFGGAFCGWIAGLPVLASAMLVPPGADGWSGRNHTRVTSRSRSMRPSVAARNRLSGSTASRWTSVTRATGYPAGNTPPRPEVTSKSPIFTSALAGR